MIEVTKMTHPYIKGLEKALLMYKSMAYIGQDHAYIDCLTNFIKQMEEHERYEQLMAYLEHYHRQSKVWYILFCFIFITNLITTLLLIGYGLYNWIYVTLPIWVLAIFFIRSSISCSNHFDSIAQELQKKNTVK